jgi:hypothetical protein
MESAFGDKLYRTSLEDIDIRPRNIFRQDLDKIHAPSEHVAKQ